MNHREAFQAEYLQCGEEAWLTLTITAEQTASNTLQSSRTISRDSIRRRGSLITAEWGGNPQGRLRENILHRGGTFQVSRPRCDPRISWDAVLLGNGQAGWPSLPAACRLPSRRDADISWVYSDMLAVRFRLRRLLRDGQERRKHTHTNTNTHRSPLIISPLVQICKRSSPQQQRCRRRWHAAVSWKNLAAHKRTKHAHTEVCTHSPPMWLAC